MFIADISWLVQTDRMVQWKVKENRKRNREHGKCHICRSGNIAHTRFLMVGRDSFKSITRQKTCKTAATLPFEAITAMKNMWNCVYNQYNYFDYGHPTEISR